MDIASMRIGILETGLVNDDLRVEHGSYPEMVSQLLKIADPHIEFTFYSVVRGELPASLAECEAYVVTGSKHNSFDEDPWIMRLKSLIRDLFDAHTPLLGICFGHQVIAHALGGRAAKSEKGWGAGIYKSYICEGLDCPWMDEGVAEYNLVVSHQDQVIKLPEGATLLASNDFCENSAYFIDNRVLSFQGHPEFTIDYAKALLQSRQSIIDPDVYNRAFASYGDGTDHHKVARWMVNFLRRERGQAIN